MQWTFCATLAASFVCLKAAAVRFKPQPKLSAEDIDPVTGNNWAHWASTSQSLSCTFQDFKHFTTLQKEKHLLEFNTLELHKMQQTSQCTRACIFLHTAMKLQREGSVRPV